MSSLLIALTWLHIVLCSALLVMFASFLLGAVTMDPKVLQSGLYLVKLCHACCRCFPFSSIYDCLIAARCTACFPDRSQAFLSQGVRDNSKSVSQQLRVFRYLLYSFGSGAPYSLFACWITLFESFIVSLYVSLVQSFLTLHAMSL